MKFKRISAVLAACIMVLSGCGNEAPSTGWKIDKEDDGRAIMKADDDAPAVQNETEDTRIFDGPSNVTEGSDVREEPKVTTTNAVTTTEPPVTTTAPDLYATSPVTHVDDQSYSYFGGSGLYSGDWKGDRPEGVGYMRFSDDTEYNGSWKNGVPAGQGSLTEYLGKGNGYIRLIGDISKGDDGSYKCFLIDDDGYLVAVGRYKSGVFTNVFDDPDCISCEYKMTSTESFNETLKKEGKTPSFTRYYGEGTGDEQDGYGLYIKKDSILGARDQYYMVFTYWNNGAANGPTTSYDYLQDGVVCRKGVYDRGTKVGTWTKTIMSESTKTVQDWLVRNPKVTQCVSVAEFTYADTKEAVESSDIPKMDEGKFISMIKYEEESSTIERSTFADKTDYNTKYFWLDYKPSLGTYEGECFVYDEKTVLKEKYEWVKGEGWEKTYTEPISVKVLDLILNGKEKASAFLKIFADDTIDKVFDKIKKSAYDDSFFTGKVAELTTPFLAASAKAAAEAGIDYLLE